MAKGKKKDRASRQHYVYILRCSNGDLYSGYTLDPARRISLHNQGKASKFTRSRLPVKLVHLETLSSKSQALKREIMIKRLSRKEKMKVISEGRIEWVYKAVNIR